MQPIEARQSYPQYGAPAPQPSIELVVQPQQPPIGSGFYAPNMAQQIPQYGAAQFTAANSNPPQLMVQQNPPVPTVFVVQPPPQPLPAPPPVHKAGRAFIIIALGVPPVVFLV